MTKQIGACPECDSARVQRQSSPRGFEDAPKYTCRNCRSRFDELEYREIKTHNNSLGDSLAAKLDAMEADEVSS